MTLCTFRQSSATWVTCVACGKKLPKPRGGIANIKSACSGPRTMPGVIQQAKNLAQTAVAVAADGFTLATKEQQLERLEICRACDQYDAVHGRCFACGCHLKAKATLRAAECPLGKWPELTASYPWYNKPFTGPLTRNLIMFVFPVKAAAGMVAEWRRNLSQILQRIDTFNGKRIFAVATDSTTDTLDDVEQVLTGHQCEILQFSNRRDLGEVVAFKRLLERVQSTEPNKITYYCHAKGASKQHNASQIPQIRRWADAMHEVLLDGLDEVETALNTKTFAGAFRAISSQFPSGVTPAFNWHYPGTFFWFRNDAIFSNSTWDKVSEQYWGSEAWPGTQCPVSQAACLLMDKVGLATLYTPLTWETQAQPILDRWRGRRLEMQHDQA